MGGCAVGLQLVAQQVSGGAVLSVASWLGRDVAVGDQGLAFLLCG